MYQWSPPTSSLVKSIYEGVYRLDIYMFNYKPFVRIIDSSVTPNLVTYSFATLQRHIPSVINLNMMLKPSKFKAILDPSKDPNDYITLEMYNAYFTGMTNQVDNENYMSQTRF